MPASTANSYQDGYEVVSVSPIARDFSVNNGDSVHPARASNIAHGADRLSQLEDRVSQLNRALFKLGLSKDEKLKSCEQKVDTCVGETEELGSFMNTLLDKLTSLDFEKAVNNLKADVDLIKGHLVATTQTAHADVEELMAIASFYKHQYDTEVVNHANTISTLNDVNQKLVDSELEYEIANSRAAAVESKEDVMYQHVEDLKANYKSEAMFFQSKYIQEQQTVETTRNALHTLVAQNEALQNDLDLANIALKQNTKARTINQVTDMTNRRIAAQSYRAPTVTVDEEEVGASI